MFLSMRLAWFFVGAGVIIRAFCVVFALLAFVSRGALTELLHPFSWRALAPVFSVLVPAENIDKSHVQQVRWVSLFDELCVIKLHVMHEVFKARACSIVAQCFTCEDHGK